MSDLADTLCIRCRQAACPGCRDIPDPWPPDLLAKPAPTSGRGKWKHMVMDATIDRFPDSHPALRFCLRSDGTPMPPDEVRAACRAARAAGFKVVPACDNHDAHGYCLGHEYEEDKGD